METVGRAAVETVTAVDVVPPALAVTLASRFVVSVVRAMPLESVFATVELNEPAVVENVTGTPVTELPEASKTAALIVDVPPLEGTDVGLAVRLIRLVAAAPSVNSRASDEAPPEIALTDARPD